MKTSTNKKVQQLQKKGTGILSSFQQLETTLTAHIQETQLLKAEIAEDIKSQQALLDDLSVSEAETSTVLGNLKTFLGKASA